VQSGKENSLQPSVQNDARRGSGAHATLQTGKLSRSAEMLSSSARVQSLAQLQEDIRDASLAGVGATAQRQAVVQCVLNLGDPMLAQKIAAMTGKKMDQVFKIMLAMKKEGVSFDDGHEQDLAREIQNRLGEKETLSQEHEKQVERANQLLENFAA